MSGPPRPKCLLHGKSDHDLCRGASRQIYGEEFHPAYFGAVVDLYSSVRPAGRLLESDQDPSEGVPK